MTKKMTPSRKSAILSAGALESANLGEIAHYLKKARHFLKYAEYSLDNADFEFSKTVLGDSYRKAEELQNHIAEWQLDIEKAAGLILKAATEKEKQDAVQQTGNTNKN